jgi:hypothetical protein
VAAQRRARAQQVRAKTRALPRRIAATPRPRLEALKRDDYAAEPPASRGFRILLMLSCTHHLDPTLNLNPHNSDIFGIVPPGSSAAGPAPALTNSTTTFIDSFSGGRGMQGALAVLGSTACLASACTSLLTLRLS